MLKGKKDDEQKKAEDEIYKDIELPEKQETKILYTHKDIFSKEDF